MGKTTRRALLIGTAAAGAGLAIGYLWMRRPFPNPLAARLGAGEITLNPYVKIGADGRVTLITPRAEMGQGVHTGLAQLLAEELDVTLAAVRVEHGPASKAYLNWEILPMSVPFPEDDRGMIANSARSFLRGLSKIVGHQITGGSSSIAEAFDGMRTAGAAARAMLIAAAAARVKLPVDKVTTESGHCIAGGQRISYGALAADAAKLSPPAGVALKPRAQWRLIGKDVPRVELKEKVTGAPIFAIDVVRPDMLFATVVMNPHIGAAMAGMDAEAAKRMPGVVTVVDLSGPHGGGFGVIADNTWRAFEAARKVKASWKPAAYKPSTQELFAELGAALDKGGGFAFRNDGNAAGTIKSSKSVVEAEYRAPFLAHTAMEPMTAAALLDKGKLTIWTGTQVPTIAVELAQREFGLSAANCEVVTTHLGGGFGRRLEIDFVRQAIMLAKAVEGRPVKLTWTREEDVTHDIFRPLALARFKGALGIDGMPAAIEARIVSPSVARSFVGRVMPSLPLAGPDRLVAEGVFDQPYTLPGYRVEGLMHDVGIPVGNWRSVGNSYGGFFHETFLDELARAGKVDPFALRLKLMEKHPTERKVVEKVAAMARWGEARPKGVGKGIAATRSFGAMVAEVVEIEDTPGGIRIRNVWAAIDVGTAVNPALIRAQVESAIVYGLSAAMMQEITFKAGRVEQSNFTDFDALRINQMPRVEVAILENQSHVGGVGEPGLPPVIPALGNAIFDLTGQRLRETPFGKAVKFAA